MTSTVPHHQPTATDTGLSALFAPRGIAVVGASRDQSKLGATLARSLSGFAARGGHLALVNGRDETMHPSLAAAAEAGPLDLAMICVPAAACPTVLDDAARAGAGAAVICGGGFAEAGGRGIGYQAALAEVVTTSGIRLLGPNTSGFLAPHAGVTASFVPGAAQVRPGRVAVVAASGGVNHALAFLLAEAGHGISLAVGIGNAVDVSAPDILDDLAADPHTSAVALHVESVADGPGSSTRCGASAPGSRSSRSLSVATTSVPSPRPTPELWRPPGVPPAPRSPRPERFSSTTSASSSTPSGRCRPPAPAPTPTPGSVSSPPRPDPGCSCSTTCAGRRARVPELTRETRDTLATLLPPLTYQANPVDTGRPGPELARVLHAVAADPHVDLVAAYALHEPDAVDLVAATRTGRVLDVPVVLGLGGIGDDVMAVRRALTRGRDRGGRRAARGGRSGRSAARRRPRPVTARPHSRPGRGAHRCGRRARRTPGESSARPDRDHHSGPPGLWRSQLRPASPSPNSAARSR